MLQVLTALAQIPLLVCFLTQKIILPGLQTHNTKHLASHNHHWQFIIFNFNCHFKSQYNMSSPWLSLLPHFYEDLISES